MFAIIPAGRRNCDFRNFTKKTSNWNFLENAAWSIKNGYLVFGF